MQGQPMPPARKTITREVAGPWSLEVSRQFWEGFAPAALPEHTAGGMLATVFLVDADWSRARAGVVQYRQEAESCTPSGMSRTATVVPGRIWSFAPTSIR